MLTPRRRLAACIRRSLGVAGLCMFGGALHAETPAPDSEPVEALFDTRLLESRGISADVARFFSRGARFLPGLQEVRLSVNAGRPKPMQVRFDSDGELCFDRALLGQLGLRSPEADDGCLDRGALYPGMRVALHPGRATVDLTVPENAFDPEQREATHQRGGSAAILNYNVFAQRFQGLSGTRNYLQGRIESGFNFSNWIVRSSGTYAHSEQRDSFRAGTLYAQRSIEPMRALLQAGQINAFADGIGGMPVLGAQVFSDSAQLQGSTLTVPIQGIADTNAVVEVRQRGQVVYRTVVAPGAYSLSDIGGLSNGSDIEVIVTEEDGRVSRSSLPAPMSQSVVGLPATYSLGIGQYRREWGSQIAGQLPWVAYGGYAFNAGSQLRLSASALLSLNYQSTYGQVSFGSDNLWLGGSARLSRSTKKGLGHEWQVQGSASLGGHVSAGLSWQSRSSGFSTLEDTFFHPVYDEDLESLYRSPFQQSLSASLTWSSLSWGAFNYSLSRSRDSQRIHTTHAISASRKFGRLSASLSLQWAGQGRGAAYLNLRMPLGSGSVGARLQRQGSGDLVGAANYQGRLGRDIGVQVDASGSRSDRRLSASAQSGTSFAQWSVGASTTNSGSHSFNGSMNGGLAFTDEGMLAMSSGRIGDTFAVIKIPGVSGIRMGGNGGGAKTSPLGTALVPNIYPYQRARIQLDGKSLPLNYRFDTTAVDFNLARGTVASYVINATQIRQLMLRVRLDSGAFARVGTGVFDGERQFMGTVVGDGNVVLTNEQIGQKVFLESVGGFRCEVRYQAPERFDSDAPYEEADATCS